MVVDLFAVGVGLHELPITAIRSDSSVRILATDPETVTVALEQRKEKEVPVRVNLAGSPPQGYEYQPPKFLPDIVTVIGPASKVELVDAAWIDVEVDDARSTMNLTQRAVPRDAQGQRRKRRSARSRRRSGYGAGRTRDFLQGRARSRKHRGPARSGLLDRAVPCFTSLGNTRRLAEELKGMEFVFTETVPVDGATQTLRRL